MVGVFDRYCLAHLGDAAALRHAAAASSLPTEPPSSPTAMLARPGIVFDAGHRVLLLSLDNGVCGVMGGPVDGGAVLAAFASAMATRGIDVAPVGSAPDGAPQAYRLSGKTVDATLMVDIRGAPVAAATVSILATAGGGT